MKRLCIGIVAAALVLSACSSSKTVSAATKAAKDSDVISFREEISFPVGQRIDSPAFTGAAYITPLIENEDTYNFPKTDNVVFEPGARSDWHEHGGMIVLVTDGVGYYQEEGKKAQILRKGDIVEIPAGVRHWHGATPDSWFSQMVIYDSRYEGGNAAGVRVTGQEYANLEAEEYTGRDTIKYGDLMFGRAEYSSLLPTFSGPVYVSEPVGADNVAGAPGLHYVAFDPGTINNWHTHEGGQILIATDGIGYHQIEGQPVQVLHPGDVAFCPPGVKHWHGGSAGTTFAHIAANTNPELTGLEWFGRISDAVYAALPKE